MSALSFLNPVYLAALGLVVIPILIHLIRRRRIKLIPWAAWDFLLQSRRKNRRRLRIEQLLLLLLRILIVCLVVLAFARPILRMIGSRLMTADTRVHALIVIDNSYSMGFKTGGQSDFDRAKKVADNLLSRVLKQGDSVQLVLLSSRPEAPIKEATFSLSKARDRVRVAKLSDLSTDYGAAAAFCLPLLKNVRTPTREIYWITDSQKIGFPAAGADRAQAAWKELSTLGRITWVNVAQTDRENLAVLAPVFSRELITPQAPVRIEAEVRNYSSSTRNGLMANLYVDGHMAGSTRVNVPSKGKAKASFLYLFDKAGAHSGYVRLAQADSLEVDNTAFFAAKVREKLRVLIIDPRPASDLARDEAFFLHTALAPIGASGGGGTAIQPTIHVGPRLAGLNLRSYDAVVIAGLTTFDPTDRRIAEDFVNNGGGMLIFPGLYTEAGQVNSVLAGANGLLPARLGAKRSYPADGALTLNPATINHPALNSFKDSADINLGSARFTQLYDLAPALDAGVRVLCKFSDSKPAFVERRFGQGKVILAASTAGTSGNELPFKPAYLPLIHQLVAYLAAGPTAQRNLNIGAAITARFDVQEANKPVRVTNPAGETSLIHSNLGADGVTAVFSNTQRAGIYSFGLAGKDMADCFAFNRPEIESDLASADDRQVQAGLGPIPAQYARGSDDITSVVHHARHGTEIWRNLILAALSLLFLEALLAQRFGRR